MSRGQDRGTLDWLVELAGASAPAAAAGFAAMLLAPSFGVAPGVALLAGFGAMFGLAFAAMRVVPPEPRLLALPIFEQPELQDDALALVEALARAELLLDTRYPRHDELLLDTRYPGPDELLLDTPYADCEELLLDSPYAALNVLLLDTRLGEPEDLTAVAELLLDDPLPAPPPDSRVVQLFAGGRMPTAGQLQQRIDRHLAAVEQPAVAQHDASDALSEALAELRRSLRQA